MYSVRVQQVVETLVDRRYHEMGDVPESTLAERACHEVTMLAEHQLQQRLITSCVSHTSVSQ
jgi:hypothetical protein